jgi:hypothetical protein
LIGVEGRGDFNPCLHHGHTNSGKNFEITVFAKDLRLQ